MTTKGKTMKSFGYLRVSHLESLNGTSFDTQEKKIRQYAELHDLKVDEVKSEVVSGAVEFRRRPAMNNNCLNKKRSREDLNFYCVLVFIINHTYNIYNLGEVVSF